MLLGPRLGTPLGTLVTMPCVAIDEAPVYENREHNVGLVWTAAEREGIGEFFTVVKCPGP